MCVALLHVPNGAAETGPIKVLLVRTKLFNDLGCQRRVLIADLLNRLDLKKRLIVRNENLATDGVEIDIDEQRARLEVVRFHQSFIASERASGIIIHWWTDQRAPAGA